MSDVQTEVGVAVEGSRDGEGTFADPSDVPVAGGHALAEAQRVDEARSELEAQNVADAVAPATGSNVHADFSAEDRYFGVGDKL